METYILIYFIRLVQTDFLLSGKSIFLARAILLLVETIIGIRSNQSKKELILTYWTADFLANGNHFFLHFSETPASEIFFRLMETSFSMKTFIETDVVVQM